MKKLTTLLAAFLFTTGMVFAQTNTATVDQTGDNQVANATQSGATNTVDIDQLSTNTGPQTATALQTGTSNSAVVNQSQTGGGGNTPANSAYIEQLGTSNMSTQIQTAPGYNSGQSVWGFQDGTSNELSQTISGGYTNSLRAEQYGTENIANQSANGPYADGNVYQDGTANVAEQTLTGSNNGYGGAVMLINQLGIENYASQIFAGSGLGHTNNAEIYQDGFDNDAYQDGTGRNLNAVLNQTGDLNMSMQTQTGNGHSSVVTQMGDNNSSTITQQ
jgi:hypothetical protein